MAERQKIGVHELHVEAHDGLSITKLTQKNDNVAPTAAEIAAVTVGYVWFKAVPTAGDYMGWVKTDTTTIKEWGAIAA
ncbi:hypothetical protein KAR91_11085 [Candidatus Pacearchaeota archaeon]|nr:hypothetical protein [Candidatus Pacearchaeota archaeon]